MLDCGEDKPDSDIRYYGLSTTDAYREQEARWLKGVVESEEYRAAPLHIVVLHMIPGGKSSWHGEQEIRRLFVPILNEASVDIMLCGHLSLIHILSGHTHYAENNTYDSHYEHVHGAACGAWWHSTINTDGTRCV